MLLESEACKRTLFHSSRDCKCLVGSRGRRFRRAAAGRKLGGGGGIILRRKIAIVTSLTRYTSSWFLCAVVCWLGGCVGGRIAAANN